MLAELGELYEHLFGVCSNGVIPNIKCQSALSNCHKYSSVYHHKEHVDDWAPAASSSFRMIAKKFRDIKLDEEKLDTCLRKAWC